MNTKKNNSETISNETKNNTVLLAKLNAIYRKQVKTSDRLRNAYNADNPDSVAIADLDHESKTLARQFQDLVSCLPPVKFNSATGEYYFKHDAIGDEIFVIRVTETRSYNVAVSADSVKDAIKQAEGMVVSGNVDPSCHNVTSVNLSFDAN